MCHQKYSVSYNECRLLMHFFNSNHIKCPPFHQNFQALNKKSQLSKNHEAKASHCLKMRTLLRAEVSAFLFDYVKNRKASSRFDLRSAATAMQCFIYGLKAFLAPSESSSPLIIITIIITIISRKQLHKFVESRLTVDAQSKQDQNMTRIFLS